LTEFEILQKAVKLRLGAIFLDVIFSQKHKQTGATFIKFRWSKWRECKRQFWMIQTFDLIFY